METPAKKRSKRTRKISPAKLKLAGDILFKKLGGLPGKCSGRMDRKLFRAALMDVGVKNVVDYLEWAEKRGGYCDCEVLLNAMPR